MTGASSLPSADRIQIVLPGAVGDIRQPAVRRPGGLRLVPLGHEERCRGAPHRRQRHLHEVVVRLALDERDTLPVGRRGGGPLAAALRVSGQT